MRARVSKLDEFQFLTCVKHGLWGSKTARFGDWQIGDKLILLVGNSLAGVAEVTGVPFRSNDRVWDNDLFPNRVPMRFSYVGLPEHRLPVLGDVRDALSKSFDGGGGWGLGILNQRLMKGEQAATILNRVAEKPNDILEVQASIDALLADADLRRKNPPKRKSPVSVELSSRVAGRTAERPDAGAVLPVQVGREGAEADNRDAETPHSRAQGMLIQLAHTVGCGAWVAANDKSKVVGNKPLGEGSLPELPNMGLSPEATRAIGLIDVLWTRKDAPVAAFEVEATTSVYSGLLRMSDLVELVPAIKLDLYIVAPRERESKVLRELGRPTFRRIGLTDTCKFIAVEDLETLLTRLNGLTGHVNATILDSISIASRHAEAIGLR